MRTLTRDQEKGCNNKFFTFYEAMASNEANLPALKDAPQTDPRVQGPYEDEEWPSRDPRETCKRARSVGG